MLDDDDPYWLEWARRTDPTELATAADLALMPFEMRLTPEQTRHLVCSVLPGESVALLGWCLKRGIDYAW